MKKKKSILVALALLTIIGSAMGTILLHFMLEKPATFQVVPSKYAVELYTNSGCTVVATQITFPDVENDLAFQPVNSSSYYIKGTNRPSGHQILLAWNHTAVEGFDVVGYSWGGEFFVSWYTHNAFVSDGTPVREVMWGIIPTGNLTEGTVDFTINILCYENVP